MNWFLAPESGKPQDIPWRVKATNVGAVVVLGAAVLGWFLASLPVQWNWPALGRYAGMFWNGWLMTVGLSAAALAASTMIGLSAALAQRSRVLALRYGAKVYVELVRGTPLLVQIYLFWYVIFQGAGREWLLPVAVLTLSVFSGAYISEQMRAGIDSVGASQWESARAIGLTRAQAYRHVVFPQALRQVTPALAGQFASLIKDSSLLSVISVHEFTFAAQNANALSYSTFEAYLPLAAGYLVLTLPISLAARWLEKRAHYET